MRTYPDLIRHRLSRLQLTDPQSATPGALLHAMGAMQAQDPAMSKLAIGIRIPGTVHAGVEAAIAGGEILRTHVLRPTWHWIAREDIHWLLELTAPRILAVMKNRLAELELDASLLHRTTTLILNALEADDTLTRAELMSCLNRNGIRTNENRASHILAHAELHGLICSGKPVGTQHTYALLERRATRQVAFQRPEAIAELAGRYFASHGPATAADFAWWSGLTLRDAKAGVASLDPARFSAAVVDAHTYWYAPAPLPAFPACLLLPAYDELIIGYTNRDALQLADNFKKVIAVNGLFRAVVLLDGQVAGIWKRTPKKDHLLIETEFFRSLTRSELEAVELAAQETGRFWGMRVQMSG